MAGKKLVRGKLSTTRAFKKLTKTLHQPQGGGDVDVFYPANEPQGGEHELTLAEFAKEFPELNIGTARGYFA
ncbi:MAG: hypothetical protein ACRCVX_16470 [Shewanella sp.]